MSTKSKRKRELKTAKSVCIIRNCTCNFSLLLLLLLRNVDVKTSRTEQTSLFFSLFVLYFLSFFLKKKKLNADSTLRRWAWSKERQRREYIFFFNIVLWYTKWHRIQAICVYEHIELIASVLATKSTEKSVLLVQIVYGDILSSYVFV